MVKKMEMKLILFIPTLAALLISKSKCSYFILHSVFQNYDISEKHILYWVVEFILCRYCQRKTWKHLGLFMVLFVR